jgi:lipopolysaccharide/colanic/teichoic acid biosynthesis glycosyltransferase
MHTTKANEVLSGVEASPDGLFFASGSSVSEQEILLIARELSAGSNQSTSRASRLLDISVALAMLVLLSPVMLITAISVATLSPGPILFSQWRVGQNGKKFRCYKFRSMRVDAEQHLASLLVARPELREEWKSNQKLSQDPRITPIGAFLRQSSIDELPQLFNVLRGEMSVVGPRPIVEDEVPRYGRYITHYLRSKPGLTGIWQVSGRNDTSYRRRVAADMLYSRKKSVGFDLWILLVTIPAVLKAHGAR